MYILTGYIKEEKQPILLKNEEKTYQKPKLSYYLIIFVIILLLVLCYGIYKRNNK